jgi:hypothetical protein
MKPFPKTPQEASQSIVFNLNYSNKEDFQICYQSYDEGVTFQLLVRFIDVDVFLNKTVIKKMEFCLIPYYRDDITLKLASPYIEINDSYNCQKVNKDYLINLNFYIVTVETPYEISNPIFFEGNIVLYNGMGLHFTNILDGAIYSDSGDNCGSRNCKCLK